MKQLEGSGLYRLWRKCSFTYGMTGREREEEDVPEVSFKYQLPLPLMVFLNSEWKWGVMES